MAFIKAGAKFRERCFLAANRVGKSYLGAYELTCHLTGWYPHWWDGKRFDHPSRAWASGDTSQTVRDIGQDVLLGSPGDFGTGMIPHDKIVDYKMKRGMPDAVESVIIRHSSGGLSRLCFKSYDQGRESFQGTALQIVWLDEEPPLNVYTECVYRTMTTGGIILCTFTPLRGISDVVMLFLEDGKLPKNANE